MLFKWEGVLPALITPFTVDDTVDMSLFKKSLLAQLSAGVRGIILGGSLGEGGQLKIDEKKQLVEAALTQVGQEVPIILNIGESTTGEAIRQVRLAFDWGVSGIMLLPPLRYKPDYRETNTYFRAVAESTELPIMIYNNPVDYGVGITIEMFEELAGVSNITAVKESTRDVTNVTRMYNHFGERYQILCGVDTLAMEELLLGAHGWVAGLVCAFPDETVRLYDLIRAGKLSEAATLYRWFMPLLELDIHPKLVQYIKLAASVTGLGSEYVRAPRLILEGEERERILKVISKSISTRPLIDH